MKVNIGKSPERENRSTLSGTHPSRSGRALIPRFVDSRHQTLAQNMLQQMSENRSQVENLTQLKALAGNPLGGQVRAQQEKKSDARPAHSSRPRAGERSPGVEKDEKASTDANPVQIFDSELTAIQFNGHISQLPKDPRILIFRRLTIQGLLNLRVSSEGQRMRVDNYINERFGIPGIVIKVFSLLTLEARSTIPMIELEQQFASWSEQGKAITEDMLELIRRENLRFVSLRDLLVYAASARYERLSLEPSPPSWHGSTKRRRFSRPIAPTVSRRGERGFYGAHAGDHSTAHAVLRRWIEMNFRGATSQQVPGIAHQLISDTDGIFDRTVGLMGSEHHKEAAISTYTRQRDAVLETIKELIEGLKIIEHTPYLNGIRPDILRSNVFLELINLRNSLPTAAMEFGGVGGGEGSAIATLDGLENQLRSGVPIHLPLGLEVTRVTRTIISNAAKLFDKGRVHSECSEIYSPDLYVQNMEMDIDQYSGPGVSGNIGVEFLIEIHIETLISTYTSLFEWLRQNELLTRVLQGIRDELGNLGEEYNPTDISE